MIKLSENQKAMLYDALIDTFIESKAENYLSLIFERDGVDMYEVLIQKIDAMTPAEKNLILEQKIAELERLIADSAVNITNNALVKIIIPKMSNTKTDYFKAGITALAYMINSEAKKLREGKK